MFDLNSQEFLEQEPQKILAAITAVIDEHPHPNKDINWLGIAEIASSNTRIKSNTMDVSLVWAEIAVLVYEYLSSPITKTNVSHVSFECSAMFIRVYCIAQFGIQKNDMLRDPQTVVEWFLVNTGMSLDEAKAQSKKWIELPREQISALRQIKNRLNVVKELYKDRHVPSNSLSSIESWIAIWQELP